MFVNAVVRNAMEDFHVKHLSDAQMRELNPIIRNAVYTALDAVHSMRRSKLASRWVMFQMLYVPSYWEQPELLEAYVDSVDPNNQWLDALLRGELAPTIESTADFDHSSAEELADHWTAAFAKKFPKAPSDAVALERPSFLEAARRAKTWRKQHPNATIFELNEALLEIYDQLTAPHGRDKNGRSIWPRDNISPIFT